LAKDKTERLNRQNGQPALAYRHSKGEAPTVVFMSGYRSDLSGTKAEALHKWADSAGRAFLRFDYSGCGESAGAFEDGTISVWLADTLAAIDALAPGPVVLVGSSMGGWLALRAALERKDRVKALVLIAPAVEFTEEVWTNLSFEERRALAETGRWTRPSAYDQSQDVFTRALIEDGRNHRMLNDVIPFDGPVRILHSQKDDAVHWRQSLLLAERLRSEDVVLTITKDSDHRLSRPQDINRLIDLIDEVL
jgi:pimeloyl-ACP methyl ester carboxylesterase